MSAHLNGGRDQASIAAAAELALTLLRRAALDLAENDASDPVIQRHFANVCNQALDLLDEEIQVHP